MRSRLIIESDRARDAKKFIEYHQRLDVAVDAYFNNPNAFASSSSKSRTKTEAPSTSKLNQLFDRYKGRLFVKQGCLPVANDVSVDEGDEITIDGTIKLCEDLEVDPEDVVMLAVAYELKSPKVGEWSRAGWVEGWKSLG